MLSTKQSNFIRDRIVQIDDAILHCPDGKFFNLQAVITHVVELDENGILWLSIDKPIDCSNGDSPSFDVVLNYHKESVAFDLDILGEAKMIDDIKEITGLSRTVKAAFKKGKMILQVNILDLDYWEQRTPVFKSIRQKLRYMFFSNAAKEDEKQLYGDHQMSA